MCDDIGEEWEQNLSSGLGLMTVMDKETGEVWCQDPDTGEDLSSYHHLGAVPRKTDCKIKTAAAAMKTWRIPKEYSKLGSPTAAECNDKKMKVIWEKANKSHSSMMEPYEVETCDEEGMSQPIVASMPLLGKLPSFCRKRQASSMEKVPEKKQDTVVKPKCKIERFLEEREGLLFVGRLLLVLLALLSPGFVLPIIFILKRMRHFQIHYHNEECPSEMIPMLHGIENKYRIPGFFFLTAGCRLCRDQRKSDKIFRIHSHLKAEHQSRLTSDSDPFY